MNFSRCRSCLPLILFALLAISILTPIGSFFSTYETVPKNDFREHVAATIQAKMAIDEGQFPIRVTPHQHEGLRYPEFQFYGVLPYTLSGTIYKILTHSHSVILNNPFNTLKLVLWAAITIGGFYAYRFSRLFTKSDVIAFLAATAYIFSPYLIINIDYRGDYTEALAQTILPIVLFYSFRLIYSENYKLLDFIFASIAWAALLTTHLITFAYSALIFIIAAGLFLWLKLSDLKRVVYACSSLATALALAAWHIVPIILYSSYIAAGGEFDGIHSGAGLKPTSLFNLLALRAGPAAEVSPSWPWFYAGVGWPMLFGFLSCCYFLIHPKISRQSHQYKLMLCVSLLSLMTFVMIWSGINIWHYLPHYFSVAEWGYRLLAQSMWLGMILFVLATETIFGKEIDARHLIVGIFIITLSVSSWISKPPDGQAVSVLLKKPDLVLGGDSGYLIRSEKIKPYPGLDKYGFIQIPLVARDSKILLNHPVSLPSNLFHLDTNFIIKGKTLKQAQRGTLVIKLDGKIVAAKAIFPNKKIDWKIPVGQLFLPKNKTITLVVDQVLASNEVDHTPMYFNKIFPMTIDLFELSAENSNKIQIFPIETVKPLCLKIKDKMQCNIDIKRDKMAVQLPALYYPDMLTVTVDGKKSDYEATFYRNAYDIEHFDSLHDGNSLTLASVILTKGAHVVTVETTGVRLANIVTLLTCISILLFGLYKMVRPNRKKYNAKH